MKKRLIFTTLTALILIAVFAAASRSRTTKPAAAHAAIAAKVSSAAAQVASAAVGNNPEREAFFGETHVHTSWSFDASFSATPGRGRKMPIKYAMGQPIDHPAGYKVKITRPLDFMAVTDHTEYAGVVPLAKRPQFTNQQIACCRKTEGPKQGRHPARVHVFGCFHSQE